MSASAFVSGHRRSDGGSDWQSLRDVREPTAPRRCVRLERDVIGSSHRLVAGIRGEERIEGRDRDPLLGSAFQSWKQRGRRQVCATEDGASRVELRMPVTLGPRGAPTLLEALRHESALDAGFYCLDRVRACRIESGRHRLRRPSSLGSSADRSASQRRRITSFLYVAPSGSKQYSSEGSILLDLMDSSFLQRLTAEWKTAL